MRPERKNRYGRFANDPLGHAPQHDLFETAAPVSWNNDQIRLECFNRREYFTNDLAGTDHKLIWNNGLPDESLRAVAG